MKGSEGSQRLKTDFTYILGELKKLDDQREYIEFVSN